MRNLYYGPFLVSETWFLCEPYIFWAFSSFIGLSRGSWKVTTSPSRLLRLSFLMGIKNMLPKMFRAIKAIEPKLELVRVQFFYRNRPSPGKIRP